MAAVDQLGPLVGVKPACQALAVPRASWYRRRRAVSLLWLGPLRKRGSGVRLGHSPKPNGKLY